MFVAKVTGSLVSTQKVDTMVGYKLLIVEPYRIEGKKTMGLELAEQMQWELPDGFTAVPFTPVVERSLGDPTQRIRSAEVDDASVADLLKIVEPSTNRIWRTQRKKRQAGNYVEAHQQGRKSSLFEQRHSAA